MIGCAKAFCANTPTMSPEPSWATQPLGSVSPTAPTELLGAAVCKGRGTLIGEHTPAPTGQNSGKLRKPFSHPAPPSQSGKAVLGCTWIPEPCCFAGSLRSLNHTPYMFSFMGKQD